MEENLKKFFRVVRSEKRGSTPESEFVRSPEECAFFLEGLFDKLSALLSDYHTRVKEESYFRSLPVESTTVVKSEMKKNDKKISRKACSNHLGSTLRAVTADGIKYACTFGTECKFKHLGSKGKSDKEVAELIATLPQPVQSDLKKALKLRST